MFKKSLHLLGKFSLFVVLLLVLSSSCAPPQNSTFLEQSQHVIDSVIAINQLAIVQILEEMSSCPEGNIQQLRNDLEASIAELKTELKKMKEKVCPEPFFKLGSECFFINDQERKNWFEAREACQSMGTDLAEPEDFRSFIDAKIEKAGNITVWFGLTDTVVDGVWVGVSGRVYDMTSAPWGSKQPNNYGGNQAYLNTWPGNCLNDGDANDRAYFACEYQLS